MEYIAHLDFKLYSLVWYNEANWAQVSIESLKIGPQGVHVSLADCIDSAFPLIVIEHKQSTQQLIFQNQSFFSLSFLK